MLRIHDSSESRLSRWVLHNVILPAADAVSGQRVLPRLRLLAAAQWWDRPQLDAYRRRRLKHLIQTAYAEVPFYRDAMRSARLRPEDIQEPTDLIRLPVTTKAQLRSAYPARVTRKTGNRTYEVCSSGSTGSPMAILEDAETAGIYRSSFLLALQWAGWKMGEAQVQTGMGIKRDSLRRIKDLLLGCYYISAADSSDGELDRTLTYMDDRAIQHLWGYPGSIYLLGRRALQKGWNRRLRSVVTWGDNLYPHYRTSIEAAFGCRVFDTYGCGEGFQIAAQCGVETTYHVHELDIILELLDDDGRPVESGQAGNAVITRLHPGPMPLIRYQIGDRVVRGERERCRCGRTLERVGGIQGRDTDMVITPSGNRLVVHVFTATLEYFPEIETFRVLQEELDKITVQFVPVPGFVPHNRFRERVVSALNNNGVRDLQIILEATDKIPLPPSGKRRFVVSKIPQ